MMRFWIQTACFVVLLSSSVMTSGFTDHCVVTGAWNRSVNGRYNKLRETNGRAHQRHVDGDVFQHETRQLFLHHFRGHWEVSGPRHHHVMVTYIRGDQTQGVWIERTSIGEWKPNQRIELDCSDTSDRSNVYDSQNDDEDDPYDDDDDDDDNFDDDDDNNNDDDHHLSTGVIIGITLFAIGTAALISGGVALCSRGKKYVRPDPTKGFTANQFSSSCPTPRSEAYFVPDNNRLDVIATKPLPNSWTGGELPLAQIPPPSYDEAVKIEDKSEKLMSKETKDQLPPSRTDPTDVKNV